MTLTLQKAGAYYLTTDAILYCLLRSPIHTALLNYIRNTNAIGRELIWSKNNAPAKC